MSQIWTCTILRRKICLCAEKVYQRNDNLSYDERLYLSHIMTAESIYSIRMFEWPRRHVCGSIYLLSVLLVRGAVCCICVVYMPVLLMWYVCIASLPKWLVYTCRRLEITCQRRGLMQTNLWDTVGCLTAAHCVAHRKQNIISIWLFWWLLSIIHHHFEVHWEKCKNHFSSEANTALSSFWFVRSTPVAISMVSVITINKSLHIYCCLLLCPTHDSTPWPSVFADQLA